MLLYKKSYYNPFFIDIGVNSYEVDNIRIFDKNGVICSAGQGWFRNDNRKSIEIPTDCKIKRKIDFDSPSAFLFSTGKKSWSTNKTKYELFIPKDAIGLKEPTATPSGLLGAYIIIWESEINGVVIENWLQLPSTIHELEREIREIGEALSHFNINSTIETNINIKSKRLQTLHEEMKKEVARLEKITAEEALQIYKSSKKENSNP